MNDFDLVIRNGRVATASDVFAADVGIIGGRIAALGERLARGRARRQIELDLAGADGLPRGGEEPDHDPHAPMLGPWRSRAG